MQVPEGGTLARSEAIQLLRKVGRGSIFHTPPVRSLTPASPAPFKAHHPSPFISSTRPLSTALLTGCGGQDNGAALVWWRPRHRSQAVCQPPRLHPRNLWLLLLAPEPTLRLPQVPRGGYCRSICSCSRRTARQGKGLLGAHPRSDG